MISRKECIVMLPTLALIEIRRRKKERKKETGSAPDIYWKLPYQRVRNLYYQRTSVRSNKATRR